MLQQHENNLGMLVGRARRVLRREFEARLAAYDLTVPQVHVLWSLWEEDGRTVSQLSSTTCSDSPTLTPLLDRMETKELIYRERDLNDRRVVRIYLLEKGKELRQAICRAGEEVAAMARRGMTDEQIDQLRSLLQLLCETMENSSDEGDGLSGVAPSRSAVVKCDE